jgi:histidine phosphatase superfamily protein (branch 1)
MKLDRFLVAAACAGMFLLTPCHARAQGGTTSTVSNPKIPRLSDVPGAQDATLLTSLKQGGYIIFFRHAATDWGQRDEMGTDFESRALQRNLSEAGKAEAAAIGKAFQALAVPIDSVFASPMWRCRDTAEIAFGRHQTRMELFGKGPVVQGTAVTAPPEGTSYRQMRVKMLATAPNPGFNRVLVGQQDPIIPLIPGLHRDELREGDALLIKPLGGGKYKVVYQMTPADWARLAAVPSTRG